MIFSMTLHVEAWMRPVKNLLDKVWIDQLFAKQNREDLMDEKPREMFIDSLGPTTEGLQVWK